MSRNNYPKASAQELEQPATASDQTITVGRSQLQHGKASDRVYLMNLVAEDMPELLPQLEHLATRHRYGKIFAKIPARWGQEFAAAGYRLEAEIPGFYQGRESGLFLGKFLKPERAAITDPEESQEIERILTLCKLQQESPPGEAERTEALESRPQGYQVRSCTLRDCAAMAALFRRVFPSYPFPVHDPTFLAQSMAQQVSYAAAWYREQMIALASAEYSTTASHAEMTDFATAPEHRRQRLAARLLTALEGEMARKGIKLAYTIARARSAGMNLIFARAGYRFAGTLINNTQICGRIESMNIWYKQLD